MAKTVQPIAIELGIKGGEKLAALNKSFRDLSKQVKLSDKDINSAVAGVAKFAKEAGNSEATIRAQIKAFEGLREQAVIGGKAYTALTQGISGLRSTLRGSSDAVEAKRKSLVALGSSANATAAQIQDVIETLTALRGETRLDSDAFNAFGQSIGRLAERFERVNQEAQDFANAQARSGRAISASSGAAKQQIKDLDLVTQALREQREELGRLEGDQKLRLGAQGLVERGVASAGRRSYEQAVAESLLGGVSIRKLLAPKDIKAANDEIARQLAELQAQIEAKLSGRIKVAFQETARSARESARAMAAAYADRELLTNLERLDKRIGELPKTATGFSQRLRELQEQLSNTSRDAGNYVQVSLEIARVQREAAAATQGLGAALVADLASGVAIKNQKNLREAIGQLQAEMAELNTTTAEGSAKYAQNASEVNRLQKELDGLANSYRTVTDVARQANAAAGGGGLNPFGVSGGRNPAYSREKEAQELEELTELERELNRLADEYVESNLSALRTIEDYRRKRHDESMSQTAEEDAAQQKAFANQKAREDELFKQEMRRRDILLQAQKAAASALGLGGREPSSLYQGIIGLSTADIRRQQQMMGKSATEVLNDINTAFERGGRAVDLKGKSTDIGDSIAEGITKGASDSDDINKGAKTFAERLIAAYRRVFEIRSPSKRTEQKIGLPLGLGIIKGLIRGLRQGKREVQQEIESIVETPIPRSRQPRRLIGTVNQPIATFTGYGTVARPATPGYRPLGSAPAEVSREIDQMFNRFRAGIAALTTDTEIYYNLLKRLPASRITTDLADLATRRGRAAEIPGFIETQRLIGPGDLEREITASVSRYLRDVRTPNPWVGVIGDYKAFINSVASQTRNLRSSIRALPPGRIAGLLPPASQNLTQAQRDRIAQAYARSDERSARISAEDARNRFGPAALPPGVTGGALSLISSFAGGGSGGGGRRGSRGAAGGGGAFANLNRTLVDFGRLSDRSTADIRELGASLKGLQDILSPLDADFEAVNKAIERQSRLIDRELSKRERRRGRRFSASKFAQSAGATLSGGIFGGPEGFLGGLGGAILGGPGGAFAGAAAGAQVGQLRKVIGDTATYASELQKLRIALDGVAQGTGEYQSALKAAQQVTNDFNVPQDVAIKGMTRLAAAVKGANGPITDAELVLKNVSAAIKATGGNAQDIEGAITAMVQVFSKGKVSAEELSGQLGERLPGAVTLFAEANKLSLVELQDALKKGEVGLNELMKFIEELGNTYGDTARKIADSNAEAGARLERDISLLRDQLGTALIPIGAAFQEAFAEFIREITPTLVEVLPKIAQFFLDVFKNIELVTQAAIAMLTALAVGKIAALVASVGGLSAAMGALTISAANATKSLIGLNATALLNPYTALAAGVAVLAANLYNAAQEQKRLNLLIREGGVAEIDKQIVATEAELFQLEQNYIKRGGENQGRLARAVYYEERDELADQLKDLRSGRSRAVYDATQGADLPDTLLPRLSRYDDPRPDGTGAGTSGGSGSKRKSQLDDLRYLSESLSRKREIYKIDEALRATALVLVRAEEDKNKEMIAQLRSSQIELEADKVRQEIQGQYLDAIRAANKLETEEERQQATSNALDERSLELENLKLKVKDQQLALTQELAIAAEREAKALDQARFALRDQLGLVSRGDRVAQAQADFREQYPGASEADLDLVRQTIDPTFSEGVAQNIRTLKEELTKLIDPINQVTNAANAIGTAFADSFTSAIDGSATAQEALAGFFSNLSRYFLEAAGQIIQKMITIAILNQVARVLPGSGGSGFSFFGGSADAGLSAANLLGGIGSLVGFANGGAFDKGVVRKPMMFAYANGGVDRFGLMGESGPEAIMPLRRDSSGRLGVDASGGSSNNIVVNVDASGTQVQGDNTRAKELGSVISAAVQAELIKQRRPGGLLVS